MTDIKYWADEYQRETEEFKVVVDKLKALVESSNLKAMDSANKDCDGKSNRVKEVQKSFWIEYKLIRDKAIKAEFEERGHGIDDLYKTVMNDWKRCKFPAEKGGLFDGKVGAGAGVESNPYTTEGKNNDSLLNEAHKIQDLTFESLSRTKNMIEASKEVGAATIEQLRGQREQIVEIEKEVDLMDSNLVRAEKLIGNFTRRMATDRLIQFFAAANIVVLLGLILYVAISGKSLSMSSSGGGSGAGPSTPKPSMKPTASPASSSAAILRSTQSQYHYISPTTSRITQTTRRSSLRNINQG